MYKICTSEEELDFFLKLATYTIFRALKSVAFDLSKFKFCISKEISKICVSRLLPFFCRVTSIKMYAVILNRSYKHSFVMVLLRFRQQAKMLTTV